MLIKHLYHLTCYTCDADQKPSVGDDQLLQGLEMENVGVMLPLGHALDTQALDRTCLERGFGNHSQEL